MPVRANRPALARPCPSAPSRTCISCHTVQYPRRTTALSQNHLRHRACQKRPAHRALARTHRQNTSPASRVPTRKRQAASPRSAARKSTRQAMRRPGQAVPRAAHLQSPCIREAKANTPPASCALHFSPRCRVRVAARGAEEPQLLLRQPQHDLARVDTLAVEAGNDVAVLRAQPHDPRR